jgi:hypothetical protein
MRTIGMIGSRSWNQRDRIVRYLDKHKHLIERIITGTSFGADQLVWECATVLHIPCIRMDCKWWLDRDGNERNRAIFSRCDHVVVLWDGTSPSTARAIRLLHEEFSHVTADVWLKDSAESESESVNDERHDRNVS